MTRYPISLARRRIPKVSTAFINGCLDTFLCLLIGCLDTLLFLLIGGVQTIFSSTYQVSGHPAMSCFSKGGFLVSGPRRFQKLSTPMYSLQIVH